MDTKHDQFSNGLSHCIAKAKCTHADLRITWLSLADSYRLLIDYEQRYPTTARDEVKDEAA
jgi:hypothetical protein